MDTNSVTNLKIAGKETADYRSVGDESSRTCTLSRHLSHLNINSQFLVLLNFNELGLDSDFCAIFWANILLTETKKNP